MKQIGCLDLLHSSVKNNTVNKNDRRSMKHNSTTTHFHGIKSEATLTDGLAMISNVVKNCSW